MSPVAKLKDRVCAAVDEQQPALLDLSNRIHTHPELKFEEHLAAAWLADYLTERGFAVERKAYGLPTAFAARMGQGHPQVAVLCEYDALPQVGHACGHNIIAAAGAGAAAALASIIGETGGSIIVLGTPAEEGGGGKILMAQAGAFENVDAALMVHPAGADLRAMTALAVCELEVEYTGKAAHAAAFPEQGINALDALVTAYNAIAYLRQHIRSDERIHGVITDGGQAPNIVPARSAGLFFVRAATEEKLTDLKRRVMACFEAGALATGAQWAVRKVAEEYTDLWTNSTLIDSYCANMARLGRTVLNPSEGGLRIVGSTDMGNVSKLVPAIHPMIAVSPPDVPLHSSEFARWTASDAAHRAVLDGAKALAMTATDLLADAEMRAAMRRDFEVQHESNSATTGV